MEIKFKKMKNGDIVVVYRIDEKAKILYGWNLASKNLRIKTYKLEKFEKYWKETYADISSSLRAESYYNLTEDCKYHKASVSRERYKEILLCLVDW